MQECGPHLANLPLDQEKPEIWVFIWNLLIFKCWQRVQIKTPSGQQKYICGVEVAAGCLLVTSDKGEGKESGIQRSGSSGGSDTNIACGTPPWPLGASVSPSVGCQGGLDNSRAQPSQAVRKCREWKDWRIDTMRVGHNLTPFQTLVIQREMFLFPG